MKTRQITLLASILVLFCTIRAYAQDKQPDQQKLIVGTKIVPPFVIKDATGEYSGISIELWEQMALELNLGYEYFESDNKTLLDSLQNESIDLIVAAMTLTNEREKVIDFSHPFFNTGLGIAVQKKDETGILEMIKALFSIQFIQAIASLVLLLLIVGFLMWLFERKKNKEEFDNRPARGIGAGFWWSAVTMTTVGYGDKTPKTLGGRVIGFIWMFSGIILISTFTAAITSTLTVSRLSAGVTGPEDLPKTTVGTVEFTTSEKYLKERRIAYIEYKTADEALKALKNDEINALVYDAALLQYLINKDYPAELQVLKNTFLRQDYGIAFQQGSELREPINQIILRKIHEKEWKDILFDYLGN